MDFGTGFSLMMVGATLGVCFEGMRCDNSWRRDAVNRGFACFDEKTGR